jgi:hypothetical protein
VGVTYYTLTFPYKTGQINMAMDSSGTVSAAQVNVDGKMILVDKQVKIW